MENYEKYDNIISQIRIFESPVKVKRDVNLVKFTEILILVIVLKIVWISVFHIFIAFGIYSLLEFELLALIYFVLGVSFTVYRSIIGLNTYILDLHKRKIYLVRYRKIKYSSDFSDVKSVQAKTTEHRTVKQGSQRLLSRAFSYNIQIIFKDNKEITFGDFNEQAYALKYRELFMQLLE